MLSAHVDIKAHGQTLDSRFLGSQLITFKETQPPNRFEATGSEVAKAVLVVI